jgi:pimeloyl-ACP methyl ester carboxylesterase
LSKISRPVTVASRAMVKSALACLLLVSCSASPTASSDPTPSPQPAGPKPTVVFVHGAWADTSSWDGEVSALQKQGYDARAIANPLENLTTDAETVKDFLATISGPIVLVGHSYGGAVITNAAADNPNIKALVYVDAVAPDVGETNIGLIGDESALNKKPDDQLYDHVPYPGAPADVSDVYLKKDVFAESFGSDLPADQAERLWATQRTVSTAAFTTPTAVAAWKTIPSWFFISSGDKIITAASKHQMAARAHAQVVEFDGGSHLTLISHPDAVTKVVEQAAATVH